RAPHGPLAAGEGEIDIVDDAFTRRPAVLIRGDDSGSAAAIDFAAAHLPNLWETGKQHLALDEIRYDLHRFFAFRSSAGQTATALYHLERWSKQIGEGAKNVRAEVYADVIDPKLAAFIAQQIPNATVTAAGLHAGTRCCEELHFRAPGVEFQKQAPPFAEDIVIPWEGKRLLYAVRVAAGKIRRGQEVRLNVLVSEGPDQRRKLEAQLKETLTAQGADPQRTTVRVLCAYKPGYSW